MARGAKVRDGRMVKTRGSKDLATLIGDVLEGRAQGRKGAEEHGFTALKLLVQLYLMHEGTFPDALRAFVDALGDKEDPLRRDIPPDAWAALWPSLNALKRARAQAAERINMAREAAAAAASPQIHPKEESTDGRREETRSEDEGAGEHAGPGPVGAGAGAAATEVPAADEGGAQ